MMQSHRFLEFLRNPVTARATSDSTSGDLVHAEQGIDRMQERREAFEFSSMEFRRLSRMEEHLSI